jgi:hypothetical protein
MVSADKGDTIGKLRAEAWPNGQGVKPPAGAQNSPKGLAF